MFDRKSYIREYMRKYRPLHRKELCRNQIRYWERNKEKVYAYQEKWNENNIERVRENAKNRQTRYRRRHPDRIKNSLHKHLQKFPEKYRIKGANRRARKANNGGSFTPEQWNVICLRFGNRCPSCGSRGQLGPDHIIPISKGGSSDASNIQPLCLRCNSRKGNRIIVCFLPWQGEMPWRETCE